MTGLKQKFYDITTLIQQEFERNIELYGEKIQCKKGCSKCCSQIFRITKLDGWIICEHIKTLPEPGRKQIQQKAKDYVLGTPCPALNEHGECVIYEARPVICRRFGMPIFDYKNPGNIHACELNFKDGDEIIDDKLVPNQTAIGKKWDEFKAEFNNSQPLNKGE